MKLYYTCLYSFTNKINRNLDENNYFTQWAWEFELFLLSCKPTCSLPTYLSYFQANSKVAVLGASGGIGQPLSLLLKESPMISQLSLYDIAHTPGVAADLSHIETRANVTGHMGPDQLGEALQGCDVVLIPAGVPRKPGKHNSYLRTDQPAPSLFLQQLLAPS